MKLVKKISYLVNQQASAEITISTKSPLKTYQPIRVRYDAAPWFKIPGKVLKLSIRQAELVRDALTVALSDEMMVKPSEELEYTGYVFEDDPS